MTHAACLGIGYRSLPCTSADGSSLNIGDGIHCKANLKPSADTSGCRLGVNPTTGKQYVPNCGPLPPHSTTRLHEGGNNGGAPQNECVHKCDCGGVPCGEYLWDHRNASMREWLINEHVMGATGLGNDNVTGFYFDDFWAM